MCSINCGRLFHATGCGFRFNADCFLRLVVPSDSDAGRKVSRGKPGIGVYSNVRSGASKSLKLILKF
jgi:hypothetical protein